MSPSNNSSDEEHSDESTQVRNIFSHGSFTNYASLIPSMAQIVNLLAKEKGDPLAKQAIIFAVYANLEQVFLGRPKV